MSSKVSTIDDLLSQKMHEHRDDIREAMAKLLEESTTDMSCKERRADGITAWVAPIHDALPDDVE